MNRKGFTLVEVLLVIAILAFLLIILVPNVFVLIDKNNVKSCENLKKNIESSAKVYVTNNKYYLGFGCDETNNTKEITLQELVDSGDLSLNSSGKIINPITDQEILLTTKVEVVYNCLKKEFTYKVNDIKCESKDNNEDEESFAQAIYSDDDKSLTFVKAKTINVGETYNGKTVKEVYTGFENDSYSDASLVPWHTYSNTIKKVIVEDTINPISTSYWFVNFKECSEFNLQNLITLNVTDMSKMFDGCSSLTKLDLSNFDTSNVENMEEMFALCSLLESLDLSNFDTSKVKSMEEMFYGCSDLKTLNVSNWNTSNVTTMKNMFYECGNLQDIDVSNWNTGNVTNMHYMFFKCGNLQDIDVSNWNTSNVTTVKAMFHSCSALTSLDVSDWITGKVTDMGHMFYGCSSLENLNVSNWNTSNVTSMIYMFYGASILSVDCSKFNVSNVNSRNNFKDNALGVIEPNWVV